MPSTATLKFDVVQVQPDVPPASRHGAAIPVSREHLLALAGRDRGGRPLRRDGMERSEVDGIARSALGHGRMNLDISAAAELPGTLAVRALLDRDLVGGRAGLTVTALAVRPPEHRRDQLVIGQPLA